MKHSEMKPLDRPIFLVEARCVLEHLLVDVQHDFPVLGVDGHPIPGDGEILVAHSEEAAGGEYRIGDPTLVDFRTN
jgi:hypothetical protein